MATVLATIKKMSVKSLGVNAKGVAKDMKAGERKHVATVAGVAKRVITGESGFGQWNGFRGEFIGRNEIDGKAYRSGKVFLPKEFTEELQMSVEVTDKATGEVGYRDTEFAVKVWVVEDEQQQAGYFYEVENLKKIETSDAAVRLAGEIGIDMGGGKVKETKGEPAKKK